MKIDDLPAVNAMLNAISATLIIAGWFFIKRGQQKRHIVCMASALTSSALFLASYLTYHFSKDGVVTKFTEQGFVRYLYFSILIPHVLLAFINLPMIFATVIPALRGRFEVHKRFARWTLPVWLFVSVTGVLVYLMLYQWFPPAVAQ